MNQPEERVDKETGEIIPKTEKIVPLPMLEILPSAAVESISRAEIDMQVATAKKYPRSIERFLKTAISMATMDVDTARSCFYTLKRRDQDGSEKLIQGPGIRCAEICASAFQNMRVAARIVEIGEFDLVAQGVCLDVENNISQTTENRRGIKKRNGTRFSNDMVNVVANAACAIARRNAIFSVVPRAYVNRVYEAAKRTAVGDAKTIENRRQLALDYFAKIGIKKEQVLEKVGKRGIEDVGLEEIEYLLGLVTAIENHDTTIEAEFAPKVEESDKPKTLDEVVKKEAEGKK